MSIKISNLGGCLYLTAILFVAAFWITSICVMVHFVRKFW